MLLSPRTGRTLAGTAISGFELCDAIGCTVHEFAAICEIPDLGPDFPSPHPGVQMVRKWAGGKYKQTPIFCVVDSTTIHTLRPSSDDPVGWARHCRPSAPPSPAMLRCVALFLLAAVPAAVLGVARGWVRGEREKSTAPSAA